MRSLKSKKPDIDAREVDTSILPLVIIDWQDHVSHDSWFSGAAEVAEQAKPQNVRSVGWLYAETDQGYTLVSGICPDDNDVTCMQFILKSAVTGRTDLPRPRKRRSKKDAHGLPGGADNGPDV